MVNELDIWYQYLYSGSECCHEIYTYMYIHTLHHTCTHELYKHYKFNAPFNNTHKVILMHVAILCTCIYPCLYEQCVEDNCMDCYHDDSNL